MFHPLEQHHLVIYHLFVALDVLLQDNLDGISLAVALSFSDDAICACAKGPTEAILRPRKSMSSRYLAFVQILD